MTGRLGVHASARVATFDVVVALLVITAGGALGCRDEPSASREVVQAPTMAEAGRTLSGDGVEIVIAPADVSPASAWIRAQVAEAEGAGRQPLVYVGATWCEPCQRLRAEVHRGGLDAHFPKLRLLAFDADTHAVELTRAGCATTGIPAFIRPVRRGRCSASRFMGVAEGKDVSEYVTPRLDKLLQGERAQP
jgi:thiol-disulfide isomerase/thioredoxin